VFWGTGIPAGRVGGRANTIDIAPTLASRIGVTPPDDIDGRNLLADLD
jgi:arylsulfatase A-like enzyme